MSGRSRDTLEFDLVLPLGVVANQLMKIETDLRFLNMKAVAYTPGQDDAGSTAQTAVRLDLIRAALDRIQGVVSDIESDLRPRATSPAASTKRLGAGKSIPDQDD